MQRRPFGTTGRTVGVVGQGTWRLERTPRSDAVAALRRGLELGMDHIDTAEMYGSGKAEEIVAEAFAGRRDEVFIVTKVLPSNASRRGTFAACERSLKRLATDRIDCYLLHWRGNTPLEDTIGAFEELRAAGKILSWGVSNFDVSDLEETIAGAGTAGPACNQVLYHLEERAIEHHVLPWCAERNVAVVAYTPFGERGFPGPRSKGGRVLTEIADAHGATSRQVALAFLSENPAVLAIPKASRIEHVEENAAAGNSSSAPRRSAGSARPSRWGGHPENCPPPRNSRAHVAINRDERGARAPRNRRRSRPPGRNLPYPQAWRME